jgi:hypothetical protein
MSFFGQVRQPLQQVLALVLTDPHLSELVTYRRFLDRDMDDTNQMVVTYTDFPNIRGVRLRESMMGSYTGAIAATLQTGADLFMFKFRDVPTGYSLKDRIVDSAGIVHTPKAIENIFDLAISVRLDGSS